jgi:chorismate mutase
MSESWAREDWEKALERVTGHLESFEDSIIPCILQRAQFRQNNAAHEKGKSGYEGRGNESLLDIRLRDYESSDARAGRFTMPEEVPFTKDLPAPVRLFERQKVDRVSGITLGEGNRVDLSEGILSAYMDFLGTLCEPGDDSQHGSCTDWDLPALRAIAERIHYGAMYVAECKFGMKPKEYTALIKARDSEGLRDKVTRRCKEDEIYERVRQKVEDFQKGVNPEVRRLVNPEVIVEFYRQVIKLTKEGEVQYLLQKKV